MRRFCRPGVLAISLAASTACALAGAETYQSNVDKGRALLEANCVRCHAIGKEDASQHPEALPFRVVVTRYPPDNLAEAMAEGIVSGHPDMPVFVFQPPEIEAIVAYLGSLAAAAVPSYVY